MVKVIPIFVFLAQYFFGITSGKNLPNEFKGWSLYHGYTNDAWYSPRREDSSSSKKVHEAKLTQENMSGSTSRAYYVRKLFRLTHRSANPKLPHEFPKKIEAESEIVNDTQEGFWKRRVKRETECNSNQFKCTTGGCIPARWRCDYEADCTDRSDEQGCAETLTCGSSKFKCPSGLCISVSWKCDHVDDCGDLSDEQGCVKVCGPSEFKCPNNRCIPTLAFCDDKDDCGDGTDEQKCAYRIMWTSPPPAWIVGLHEEIRTLWMKVLKGGTQVPLKWNYIQPSSWDFQLQEAVFSVDNDEIGILHHSTGQTEIFDRNDYRTRFKIRESEVATLILSEVTERESATFQCKLVMSNDISSRTFWSRIHVDVTALFVTWTTPLPAWTASNSREIRTVDMQVLEGTQRLSLTWTYQAPHGLDIQRTVFSIDDGITVDDIGLLYHLDNGSAYAIIYDRNDYRTRFKISTSEMATLIINNVTGNERATFQCKLETKSNGYWAYNIRINQLTPFLPGYSLLYAININSFTEIRKISLTYFNGKETTLVSWRRVGDFAGLDYNYQQDRLYWADSFSIYRSFLNGNGIETIHTNLPLVKGIAIDWLGDNIYWTDGYGIRVSRTDGRFLKTLASHSDYTGILLDPERGFMYWIHWGVAATNIMGSHMSHVGEERLAIEVYEPKGMAIDYSDLSPERTLFWADQRDGKGVIKKTNVVKSKTDTVMFAPYPYSISVFQEILFWDEWSTESIFKANITTLQSTVNQQAIRSQVNYPLDIKVLHRDMQKGHNLCSQLKPCTHLCLAEAEDRYQCACPDSMKTVRDVDGTATCLNQDDESGDTSSQSFQLPSPSPGTVIVDPPASNQSGLRVDNRNRPYWAIGVAVACVVLIIIVVYLVRKKKMLDKSPTFVVFQNAQPSQQGEPSQQGDPSQGGEPSQAGQL